MNKTDSNYVLNLQVKTANAILTQNIKDAKTVCSSVDEMNSKLESQIKINGMNGETLNIHIQ